MLRFPQSDTVRADVTASSARGGDICQRYGTDMYRQALFTLGDSVRSERVVCDVIAAECALAPPAERGEDDVRCRLAESVFRRCQQLAAAPARHGRRPAAPRAGDSAGYVDPDGLLSQQERGALGLVLIGGLGYVRASAALGICPYDMAVLVRTALLKLGTSSV